MGAVTGSAWKSDTVRLGGGALGVLSVSVQIRGGALGVGADQRRAPPGVPSQRPARDPYILGSKGDCVLARARDVPEAHWPALAASERVQECARRRVSRNWQRLRLPATPQDQRIGRVGQRDPQWITNCRRVVFGAQAGGRLDSSLAPRLRSRLSPMVVLCATADPWSFPPARPRDGGRRAPIRGAMFAPTAMDPETRIRLNARAPCSMASCSPCTRAHAFLKPRSFGAANRGNLPMDLASRARFQCLCIAIARARGR